MVKADFVSFKVTSRLNLRILVFGLLPVLKFIKGLGPSLHIVQIASYEKMNSITRKIT